MVPSSLPGPLKVLLYLPREKKSPAFACCCVIILSLFHFLQFTLHVLPLLSKSHHTTLLSTPVHRLSLAYSRRPAFTHNGEVDPSSRRQGKEGHGHQGKGQNRTNVGFSSEARGRFVWENNLHRSLQTSAYSLTLLLCSMFSIGTTTFFLRRL